MVIAQLIINTVSFLATIFLIHWSNAGNWSKQVNTIFQHNNLSTSEHQADHLADITYYYAIFAIILTSIVNLVRFFEGKYNQILKADSKLVSNINKIIENSFQHFLLFVSIYVYLLQNEGCTYFFMSVGLKRKHLLILPFWFLLGRVFAFIELLLSELTKYKVRFSYIGWTLTVVPYIFMIAQTLGHSPQQWI